MEGVSLLSLFALVTFLLGPLSSGGGPPASAVDFPPQHPHGNNLYAPPPPPDDRPPPPYPPRHQSTAFGSFPPFEGGHPPPEDGGAPPRPYPKRKGRPPPECAREFALTSKQYCECVVGRNDNIFCTYECECQLTHCESSQCQPTDRAIALAAVVCTVVVILCCICGALACGAYCILDRLIKREADGSPAALERAYRRMLRTSARRHRRQQQRRRILRRGPRKQDEKKKAPQLHLQVDEQLFPRRYHQLYEDSDVASLADEDEDYERERRVLSQDTEDVGLSIELESMEAGKLRPRT